MSQSRFVVDEYCWKTPARPLTEFSTALDLLSDRLEVAHQRREPVALLDDFYEWDTMAGVIIVDLLYDKSLGLLDQDVRTRLLQSLDKCETAQLPSEIPFEVEIADQRFIAPAIAWAHHQTENCRTVALLCLSSTSWHGRTTVTVNNRNKNLHFVTTEAQHLGFFRDVLETEDCNEENYQSLISSAFPQLLWVDGIWREIGRLGVFRHVRPTLTKHLSVLNDDGPSIFSGPPDEIEKRICAAGIDASDENGAAKSNHQARRERTRLFQGTERVFWWHTKITYNKGRVHFLYDPTLQKIIVGLMAQHCYLP